MTTPTTMDDGRISASADELRGISLPDLLTWHGLDSKSEGASVRARTDHHNIVVTGNTWFDNKTGTGGLGAIDLHMHLTGEDFPTACRTLTNQFRPGILARHGIEFPPRKSAEPERLPFPQLMAKYAARDDSNWPIARTYLIERRKIEPGVVDELHAAGSIYANGHRPNPGLVFLHRTSCGEVVGATMRDTRHDSAFRPTLGNKVTAWFVVGNIHEARSLVAVESPIDALSYFTLFPGRKERLAIASCSGSTVPRELMAVAYECRQSLVIGLDNDAAGERGWRKAWDQTSDWTGLKISRECPQLKDWNADLVASVQTLRITKSQKQSLHKL